MTHSEYGATIQVRLTQMLADHCGGEDTLTVQGRTVGEALRNLTARHPGLARLVWTPAGEFNEQLVAFVGQEDVRRLKGMNTPLGEDDELMLITAVEGG